MKSKQAIPVVILSFCYNCGSLLPDGLGNEQEPSCPNCSEAVASRTHRLEGRFHPYEARLLKRIYGYDDA